MTVTKLTLHLKDMNQIDTIEMLGTKLIYDVKDKNQIRSLPKKKKSCYSVSFLLWTKWAFALFEKLISLLSFFPN